MGIRKQLEKIGGGFKAEKHFFLAWFGGRLAFGKKRHGFLFRKKLKKKTFWEKFCISLISGTGKKEPLDLLKVKISFVFKIFFSLFLLQTFLQKPNSFINWEAALKYEL